MNVERCQRGARYCCLKTVLNRHVTKHFVINIRCQQRPYRRHLLATAALKHTSHTTFDKTPVSPADEAGGSTRFYWHIDAALYDSPSAAGSPQTCRYVDDTGGALPVPLGTTAFAFSVKTMFEFLLRGP